jgi:preprotein translocase subunit SecF
MQLNLTQQRHRWWLVSIAALVACAIAMALSLAQFNAPLRPGLEFVGGTHLQLTRACTTEGSCEEPIEVGRVRQIAQAQGLGNSRIQVVGERQQTLSIRTQALGVEQRSQLRAALRQALGRFDPQTIQIDTIGPIIGREILTSGLLALVVAAFGIIAYISLRFQLDYALVAILALFHDVFLTSGLFSVLGLTAGVEVNSLFLVALLTIIGFSVNDTVVIYDRIRETRRRRPSDGFEAIANEAVNRSLTRSINTTATSVLPLLAIYLFGGETLTNFALALIVGFILGAYSSIFVASTLLAWWRARQESAQAAMPSVQPSDKA